MNKLLLLTILAILHVSGLWAQNAVDSSSAVIDSSLVVWHKDGSRVMFSLSEKPKISYDGDSVVIEAATTVKYAFQAIRKMTFSETVVDKIAAPTTKKEKPFTNNGETITFLPSDKDMHVKIVLLSGIVVKEFVVRKDETITMHLGQPHGKIYIICVNGMNYKIQLR